MVSRHHRKAGDGNTRQARVDCQRRCEGTRSDGSGESSGRGCDRDRSGHRVGDADPSGEQETPSTARGSGNVDNGHTAGRHMENSRDRSAKLRVEGGCLCGSEVNAIDGLYDLSYDQRKRGCTTGVRGRLSSRLTCWLSRGLTGVCGKEGERAFY